MCAPQPGCFSDDLGTRERHDVDRIGARPVEQVLDELEERGVRPMDVLEHHDHRVLSAIRSKKSRHAEKRSSRSGATRSVSPRRCWSRGSTKARSSASSTISERTAESFVERLVRDSSSAIAGAHPDHLRQRPVGDAVAVGETAASVPPGRLVEAVEVLLELPRKPRLPHAGHRDDREQVRTALVGGRVEELLLARRSSRSRPTNGASRPAARPPPFRAATTRSARQSAIGSLLPFSCVLAGTHVRDRGFGRALRRFSDEHAPGLRLGLDARSGVDEIAGDHALPFGADRDGSLPVSTPARALSAASRSGTPATRSSAARTARSASSSCATGAPHTAMTASPMNFSTVPP